LSEDSEPKNAEELRRIEATKKRLSKYKVIEKT
jgi:hypothetical protein